MKIYKFVFLHLYGYMNIRDIVNHMLHGVSNISLLFMVTSKFRNFDFFAFKVYYRYN